MTKNQSCWADIVTHAATAHGHRIVYRVAGSGPELLLVHGMAGSSETWKHVMPSLAEHFTVVAPDLLGQGDSDKPDCDYSLETHAASLRDLMDCRGCERATVVGQSLGGGVAMMFAWLFPERCERLVLVNSGGLGGELTFYLRMLTLPGLETVFPLLCGPWLRDTGNRFSKWLDRAGLKSAPARQEIWRSYTSLADPDNRRAFFRTLHGVINFSGQAVSALDRLHHVSSLPTMIVWGEQDPFIPVSHAIAAHEALPGSILEIFEGVGHYPHCEAPERFVRLLVDFIGSTQPARLTQRTGI